MLAASSRVAFSSWVWGSQCWALTSESFPTGSSFRKPSPRSPFKATLLLREPHPLSHLCSPATPASDLSSGVTRVTSRSGRELGWGWMPCVKKTGNSRGRYQARKTKDIRLTRRSSCLVLGDKRITKAALVCMSLLWDTVGPRKRVYRWQAETTLCSLLSCTAVHICELLERQRHWRDREMFCPVSVILSTADLSCLREKGRDATCISGRGCALTLPRHGCSQQPEVPKNTSGITFSSIWQLSWAAMRHSCLIIPHPLPLLSCQWLFNLLGIDPSTPALGAPCHMEHLWWHRSISCTFSPALMVYSTRKQPWQVHCYSKRDEMKRKNSYILKEPRTTFKENHRLWARKYPQG